MKWTIIKYGHPHESRIRPIVCHPLAVRGRVEYIAETYGERPQEIARKMVAHWDAGGAIFEDEPGAEVHLGPDRILHYFLSHEASLKSALHRALTRMKARDQGFVRTGSWPGLIWILSKTDVRKVLAAIGDPDYDAIRDRDDRMLEVFAEAGVRSSGRPKDEVRAMLAKHRAKGEPDFRRQVRAVPYEDLVQ